MKLSKDALTCLGDQFWTFIATHEVKKLVIDKEVYGSLILKQLLKAPPPVASLTRRLSFTCSDGVTVKIPAAKIFLCGDVIKDIYEYSVCPDDSEPVPIQVTSGALKAVLRKVETGSEKEGESILYRIYKRALGIRTPTKAEYLHACDFLGFPLVPDMAFGKEKWAKYFGDVGEEPPLPGCIEGFLKTRCPFFPGCSVRQTHMLTLIPATVNGKPYCLDELGALMRRPKKGGYASRYGLYLAQDEYGQTPVPKSYWVLMLKSVMKNSRRKSHMAQLKMAKSKPGYEAPRLLEAATAILTHYASSGERLFSDANFSTRTAVCCQETVKGIGKGIVDFQGYFLDVRYFASIDCNAVGVAPLRKFVTTL